jgi:predicted nucleic acid-binding protein
MNMILDTAFVIAADRETRRGVAGAAHAFLTQHSTEKFYITFTVAGELASGDSANHRPVWENLCGQFAMLSWTREIAWQYGELYRKLSLAGRVIGANDLWIAATALTHRFPLVTSNVREFRRVPGLAVVSF